MYPTINTILADNSVTCYNIINRYIYTLLYMLRIQNQPVTEGLKSMKRITTNYNL